MPLLSNLPYSTGYLSENHQSLLFGKVIVPIGGLLILKNELELRTFILFVKDLFFDYLLLSFNLSKTSLFISMVGCVSNVKGRLSKDFSL